MVDSWTPYVSWMKRAPQITYNLMGSNLLHCQVEDLPGARERLELDGFHEDGYPPFLEAIAERYGVSVDQVSSATGTSGANFLVGAGLLRPGDEVLVPPRVDTKSLQNVADVTQIIYQVAVSAAVVLRLL